MFRIFESRISRISRIEINNKITIHRRGLITKDDINKGVTAHGKFDSLTGKLNDAHISDAIKGDVAKGVRICVSVVAVVLRRHCPEGASQYFAASPFGSRTVFHSR